MKILFVKKNHVVDEEGANIDTSSVYSSDFLGDVNIESENINPGSDYINEIFLYFFIPFFEIYNLIKINNIKGVKFEDRFGPVIWFEAARKKGVKFSNLIKMEFYIRAFCVFTGSFVLTILFSIILPLYTLFKFRKEYQGDIKNFAVIRSPASLSKMSFLKSSDMVFFCDDMAYAFSDSFSIYGSPLTAKLKAVLIVPIYSVLDFFAVFNDANKTLGFLHACYVTKYYVKRIPHKVNFQFYLERLFVLHKLATYYTGNKEDRFALVEKRLCAKYGFVCICVPHGLEYSYKMPAGLVGDVFYCNSSYAKEYLAKIYADSNTDFVFDNKVVRKMLSRNYKSSTGTRLIFFPESREPEKNLNIIKKLKEWKVDFFIKLHTLDSYENYLPYISHDMLIDNFDEAISNNICLARKSTVLLEALYNQSIPIAVLVDTKDKSYVEFMFPSLNDKSILHVSTFVQLKKLLLRLEVGCV